MAGAQSVEGNESASSSQHLPEGVSLSRGKVRDIYDLGSELVIFTSDRVSAYDRVLGEIPTKGEVLNRLSLFWFRNTSDIVPNHIIEEVSPRTVCVRKCRVLPVEVVVRAYLTGSAWRDYRARRDISGIRLPDGLSEFARFEAPVITPSTKEALGHHDRPISSEEIVASGLIDRDIWAEVERRALGLFERGSKLAASRGLVLVDTKYEFGLLDGELILADEVHTPDSSRYWYRSSYEDAISHGHAPRHLDKEFLRRWLADHGFAGEGEVPVIPPEVIREVSERYAATFEELTGEKFVPTAGNAQSEEKKILSYIRKRLA